MCAYGLIVEENIVNPVCQFVSASGFTKLTSFDLAFSFLNIDRAKQYGHKSIYRTVSYDREVMEKTQIFIQQNPRVLHITVWCKATNVAVS